MTFGSLVLVLAVLGSAPISERELRGLTVCVIVGGVKAPVAGGGAMGAAWATSPREARRAVGGRSGAWARAAAGPASSSREQTAGR